MKTTHTSRSTRRRGNIVVMFAVFLMLMMAMLAFAIDIGVIAHDRATLQMAADAAALASTAVMERGGRTINSDEVAAMATEYFAANVGSVNRLADVTPVVELGRWNADGKVFQSNIGATRKIDAVRITVEIQRELFFGRVLTSEPRSIRVESIAVGGRNADDGQRDFVLITDQTDSLIGDGDVYDAIDAVIPQNPKRAVKSAAERFIDMVLDSSTDDRIAVTGFASVTQAELPPSDIAATVKSVFDPLRPEAFVYSRDDYDNKNPATDPYPGDADLGVAIYGTDWGQVGGYEIISGANEREDAEKILVLIAGTEPALPESDPVGAAQASAAQLASLGVTVHVIAVGIDSDVLRSLVTEDGSYHFVATDGIYSDIVAGLDTAFDEISGQEPEPSRLVR